MSENARDEETARTPLLEPASGNGNGGYDAVGMPTQAVSSSSRRRREVHHNDARRVKLMLLNITLLILVVYFAGVAWSYTSNHAKRGEPDIIYNNGTHDFHPTVIMISLDGVVNHDLDLSMTSNLSYLADHGVRARWMTPSFPPITFPNHWSLVTGLYPEAHGIISNYFYDPVLNDTFNYKDPAHSWDSKWWGGEPIWITAVRQGKVAATIMWPGCSVDFNGLRPTLSIPYNDDMTFSSKVDQTLEWLDLPLHVRPQLINLYVPQIDQAGHKYGPYANETLKQLRMADDSVGQLLEGLAARNLTNIVHVVVVSDHGMSALDVSRIIYYDEELTADELNLIETIEADPLLEIRLRSETEENIEKLYRAFQRLEAKRGHFKVYKKQDFPARFHYSHNVRIPPLIVLPEAGWRLITRRESPDQKGAWFPNGTHGYDNLDPQSRAIFVARGPMFAEHHGKMLKPFWNVELYQVLSRILNIKPASNNGTLAGVLQVDDDDE